MAHVYRVTLQAIQGDNSIVNALHYVTEDSAWVASEAAAVDVAQKVRDALATSWRAFFPAAWTCQPVYAAEVQDPLDPSAQRAAGISTAMGVGTNAGSQTGPLELCGTLKFSTEFAGRSFRGHCFCPPALSSSAATGETLSTSYKTLMQAFADALATNLTSGLFGLQSIEQVIYSRTRHARGISPMYAKVRSRQVVDRARWLRSRGS